MLRTFLAIIALMIIPGVSVGADAQTFSFGGDEYAAGQQIAI